MRRIGLFGGSFNPIHMGHLIIGQTAYESLQLDEVVFVPAKHPPHKEAQRLAPAMHRCAMVRLAIKGNERFRLSTMEIRRRGTSYSIETVRQLRAKHPGAKIFFIIGADTLPELRTWKQIKTLAQLCTFAVAVRPGAPMRGLSKLGSILGRKAVARMRSNIIDTPAVGISSTGIRQRIAAGASITYMVPAEVETYIRTHGLYYSKSARRCDDATA